MGHSASKNTKINKNRNRQKMFRIGISLGQNDLNVEGHLQMGYNSKTIKNYNKLVETQPVETEATEENHEMLRRKNNVCFIQGVIVNMDDYLMSVYYDPKRSAGFSRAVARTLIGGVFIHIFMFCPTSFC